MAFHIVRTQSNITTGNWDFHTLAEDLTVAINGLQVVSTRNGKDWEIIDSDMGKLLIELINK